MMGTGKRILVLGKTYTHGLFCGAWWLVVLWFLAIVLNTGCLAWDGRVVVWCRISQEQMVNAGSKEASISSFLSEAFCWGWVVVAFFYCLPAVQMPLASSHSISQVLWLRLTPTNPIEMAIGRIFRLVMAACFLGLLGGSWALICAWYHSVSPSGLLLLLGGFLTHLLGSSGLALLFSLGAKSEKERDFYGFTSFLIPWLSSICYLPFCQQGGWWLEWWPYAAPFTFMMLQDGKHFISCALLGLVFITMYLALHCGQAILNHSNSR